MNKNTLCLWTAFMLLFHSLIAQNQLNFEHLPVNGVTCILQDREGFIWIGTYDGLNRYDGYQFKEYRHHPENPHSLSNNYIRAIFEDQHGNLWIGTRGGGLNQFDPDTEKFIHYRNNPNDAYSLSDDRVEAIFEDHLGYLWIGTWGGGLNRLDPFSIHSKTQRSFTRFKHHSDQPASLSDNSVFAIYEDSQHNLWIGTWHGGLNRWNPQIRGFDHYRNDPENPRSISEGAIRCIYEDRQDNLWIGIWGGGLNRFDRRTNTFTSYRHHPKDPSSLANDRVWAIYEDRQNNFWIGTRGGGLSLMNRSNGRFVHYRHASHDPSSLSDNFIRAIFEDAQGNLWLGMDTEWGGLDRLDRTSSWIDHFRHHPDDPNSLSDDFIRAIHEDQEGNLWVGTLKGLNYINRTTGKVIHYQHHPGDPGSLTHALIRSIYEDRQGNLWIGTWGGGLDRLDRIKGRFEHFRHDPNDPTSISCDMIFYGLYEDRQGNFWVSTYGGGLNRMNRSTGQFEHFRHHPDDPHSISDDIVRDVFEDSHGNLWIGLEGGGLNRLDRATGRFERFQHDPTDSLSLSGDYVNVIYEDHSGKVWIGTWGGGLNLLEENPLSGQIQFRHFREKDGLANDIVLGILEDEQQRLWLSTRRGLSCLDPITFTFTNYDIRDNERQINNWAYFRGVNGEFFFGGGIGGLYHFNPDKLVDNEYIPPIVFTRFARYNKNDKHMHPIIDPGINKRDTVFLSYNDHILDFEFAALNFIKPEENQYAYRLEGLNDQWIYLGNKHSIMLTSLDPGQYVLHIKGSNNKGVWNTTGRKLTIIISPPWWWREWSKILYALLILGLLYVIRREELSLQRAKLLMEKEKNAHLQRVDQLKNQFLSNTSHELRTPLHGIIGLSESLYDSANTITPEETRNNLSLIISSSKRLANMVNDILDFSKLKNHQLELRKKAVHIKPLVEVILKINQFLVANKPLRLEQDIPENLAPVLADEERLQQILFNLVGNAIKYSEKGFVRIGVATETSKDIPQKMICIYVKDTGIGIPKHQQEIIFQPFQQADSSISREFGGSGLGLSITRHLVELHGGKIWVESEENKGATFFFTLPILAENISTEILQPSSPKTVISSVKTVTVPTVNNNTTLLLTQNENKTIPRNKHAQKHILIVDDDPVNHRVLKNYLSDKSLIITSVLSGEKALKILEGGEYFDLVLLDIMMPRISGYEVCQKIREKFLPNELPVILISAKNLVQDLTQGFSLGANDYLVKPFHKQELLARVQTQLDLHQIHSVTSKFVPNEFLRLLGRNRITDVSLGDQAEMMVTVFFNDIRDYTSLSETMTPEENFRFVNAYNGRMGPFIRKNNGFINQYLGDAIMAIFPHTPVDALWAAIEMQTALRAYNLERIPKGKKPIRAGSGLHTGHLIMGIIGDNQRMDAATISDTVNTASRIESLTKYYDVNILLSEDCLHEIQSATPSLINRFYFRYLGQVQVKGKSEPVRIHECINGDEPEIMEKKIRTIMDFEQGFEYFQKRDFLSAIASFEWLLKKNPDDTATQFFLKKARFYQKYGVPSNWHGIELMNEK